MSTIDSTACVHAEKCGGCQYQGMSYDDTLKIKEEMVRDLFSPLFDLKEVYRGILPSPDILGYRNKMEYSFGDEVKGGPLTLGLHKKKSFYDVITVDGCKIAPQDFDEILKCTLEFFQKTGLKYYHKKKKEGYLRHLLLRRGRNTGMLLIDLVTADFPEGEINEHELLMRYTDALLDLQKNGIVKDKIVGILHTRNNSPADAVIDEGTEILYGEDSFSDSVLGITFHISPFSFFQTNTRGAEVLYSVVRKYVLAAKEQEKYSLLYDLYCGTGTITQVLSPVADKVVGVEIVPEAVEKAKENALREGITNCEFICGDVLKALDDMPEKPDMIVLDPPRAGVVPKALKKILSYGVKDIVYVSCKAVSLSQNLPAFFEAGYAVKDMTVVDMFPYTKNYETVCLLTKLHEAKHHINVKVDMDELDLTSAEAKATYKEIEEWVQEHYGFHVTNLNIAQVKQKHGIIERENYNKPKSENSRQPGCPEEKVKAIEDALRHFQMI